MPEKPRTAGGYSSEQVTLVRATCLYVATKLGDVLNDLVVVGGLVPSLLIDQNALPSGADAHAGTTDLDFGLTLAVLEAGRYRRLTAALRSAGFSPATNEQGNPTLQRWKADEVGGVTVDFLIPPSLPGDRGGNLRNLEPDFAAIIAPGLHLAFQDQELVTLSGLTVLGEQAIRPIRVCGPGAFVVLKALAFNLRGENKDAYDLFYLIRNYTSRVEGVASRLRPLVADAEASKAIEILRRDFLGHDAVGPRRVAAFINGGPDDAIQAEVVGFVSELLQDITE